MDKRQKQSNKDKGSEQKSTAAKILRNKALEIDGGDNSWLIGGIVENGIASPEFSSKKPTPPPNPTVLPFPVARHRSHGPHWNPLVNKNDDNEERDDEYEGKFADFDSIASFAKPVQRKEKKGLSFSQWKELTQGDDSSVNKERKVVKSNVGAKQKKVEEVTSTASRKSFHSDYSKGDADEVASMEVDEGLHSNSFRSLSRTENAMRNESRVGVVSDMDVDNTHELNLRDNGQNASSDNLNVEAKPMDIYSQIGAERVQLEKTKKVDSMASMAPQTCLENEQGSMSLETEIDAENRDRLESMSPKEIAEAQAEIMQRMDPGLLKLLKKRGSDKLKKQKHLSSNQGSNGSMFSMQDGNQTSKVENIPHKENIVSQKEKAASSTNTNRGPDNDLKQNLDPPNRVFWNAWSERVEAVRDLRFSLDGTVVQDSFDPMSDTDYGVSSNKRLSVDNVAERDFLRTEGDPGAAGYTIKEAITLTRSTVPGQRSLALHLLASVLEKASYNISQKQVGCALVNDNKVDRAGDWEAVWAYALGPEPELVLSIRIAIDDNHNSVVLACARVIYNILSCDANEHLFDISEKLASIGKNIYTAPVFRSKPEIDVGFLRGGFWKYSAKSSSLLPFGEDNADDEAEGKRTIQDDIFVAGQDFAAGLVRMGILPRIRYILETEPTAALEECMISILIALARHSPTSVDAIMKCQRLVETIVLRFTTTSNVDVYPSKIKSVRLLKVLAQSDRQTCLMFINNGTFRAMTWHLYQNASSLDQWLKLGREKCKLSSALMVQQLRFWKVGIQSGYCISYFSDIFPVLCLWLNPPSVERLVEVNVLSEFASVTTEAYLVLEALARRLPNFYIDKLLNKQSPEDVNGEGEMWCWSHLGAVIDFAMKWISLKPWLLDLQNVIKGNFTNQEMVVSSLLWAYSAVMCMLSRVLERVIPDDSINLDKYGGHVPWLPEFVPKVGLEIIKNGLLSFKDEYDTEYGKRFDGCSSFIEELCCLRQQCGYETSLASACCLHELVRVVISVNSLIQKANVANPQGCSLPREDNLLASGIVKNSLAEFRRMFDFFSKLVASESRLVQSVETFSRGGPAPGVGVGWGAPGGGFWSVTSLLAEMEATLVIQLLEVFLGWSAEESSNDDEISFTMQMVNSSLTACLSAGPRARDTVQKAFSVMLQVPVLKCLDICIHRFLQLNQRIKSFEWNYNEEDYMFFSNILTSHFENRWLLSKKKSKAKNGNGISKETVSLETIPEDSESLDEMTQGNSLAVEWAHQRLPLPTHWFLSPISTLCDSKYAGLKSASNLESVMKEPSKIIEVAKAGMFFLLGIETMSHILSPNVSCPVRSVPLIWKLHSLSVILLVGMGVLEEERSKDVFESLQELYGQLLENETEFLGFQAEIHESYSVFIDTLVEQYAGVSYGDLLFSRQVSVYLHRHTEVPVRLAAWNALSNARVLELLPPLLNCLGGSKGYLEPTEDDDSILEAYTKSWTSSALDKAATRGSMAFTLVLHHLSSFVFYSNNNSLLRNRLVKSLLRDYSRKQQHEGIMLQFIRYNKTWTSPEGKEGSGLQRGDIEERFEILKEACEGNSSLLTVVEKLKSVCTKQQ